MTILCAAFPGPGGFEVFSLDTEDGECMGHHLSSSLEWAMWDIGYSGGQWHMDRLREKYPGGFQMTWISDPNSDPFWLNAIKKNHDRAKMQVVK